MSHDVRRAKDLVLLTLQNCDSMNDARLVQLLQQHGYDASTIDLVLAWLEHEGLIEWHPHQ
jgi:hypothetical protein